MNRHLLKVLLPVLLAAPVFAVAETPEPGEIVDRMIAAAGGEAFPKLGVVKLEVNQEETRNDGTSSKSSYTVYVDAENLNNLRIEYPGDIVIGRAGAVGWSTDKGVPDDRPQTPAMARKTLNQTVFPLLMPYSLNMEGVWVKEIRENTIDGREVWVLAIPFAKGFFTSPLMTTTWFVVVDASDYSILWYEFMPPVEYRKVSPVGIRYRILKTTELDSAKVAAQLLLIGINSSGMESGANRVTKIEASVHGSWDPTLFLSPQRIEALEQDD
jgi:hypothetical protein